MGDMKHTPGEWRIDDDGDGLRIVGSPAWPCTRFGVKGEWDVAIIERLDDFPDEEAANARLIAAAPELLEVAIYAEAILADVFSGTVDPVTALDAISDLAKPAIAKARGDGQ